MANKPLAFRDVEGEIVRRALQDDAFAARLRADPKAAMQEELERQGIEVTLPDSVQVKVLEESPELLYVVLPAKGKPSAQGELTDQQLESIAGAGWGWSNPNAPSTACMTSSGCDGNWCS